MFSQWYVYTKQKKEERRRKTSEKRPEGNHKKFSFFFFTCSCTDMKKFLCTKKLQNKIMENLFDITSARKFHFLSIFYVCFIHKIIFAFLHPMEKVFPPFSLLFHFVPSLICYFQSNNKKKSIWRKQKTFCQKFFNQNNTFLSSLLCLAFLLLVKSCKTRSIKVTNNKTKQTKQNYKK